MGRVFLFLVLLRSQPPINAGAACAGPPSAHDTHCGTDLRLTLGNARVNRFARARRVQPTLDLLERTVIESTASIRTRPREAKGDGPSLPRRRFASLEKPFFAERRSDQMLCKSLVRGVLRGALEVARAPSLAQTHRASEIISTPMASGPVASMMAGIGSDRAWS